MLPLFVAEPAIWRGADMSGRLHWYCRFMQKLEDEPRLEVDNLHPAYRELRPFRHP